GAMMTKKTLLFNGTLYTRDGTHREGWLLVDGSRIAALGEGEPPEIEARRLDLGGQRLIPGLIDIHVHGAMGHDTMDATPQALEEMARFYARHGVTGFLATTVAASEKAIMAALENIARVMRQGTGGARILGAHVEGPYLNVERRGAQHAEEVRLAQPQEYRRFFATGVVRLITLAPEYPENQELLRFAVTHGAAVAIGHTKASYEIIRQAVALGATQVTHLFNGMEPMHHRNPGVVGAALTLDALYCQLIADNIHIQPPVLKLAVRAKGPERIILITDAMRGTGMPDGDYTLGEEKVTVRQGIARTETGALAGSTLTLERALANIMAATELSFAEALPMATRIPAQTLGLERHKGSLAVGMDADLAVIDDNFQVSLTMVEGEIVYQKG
ncbi:MAG: N-acetylglucosamine-6-phosphate deacetylase, partial [Anaerolineae bacterium]|nr:N-acetylglucosamine-6-phosphate deacetylase [Anaerolineae bacterium]